jgi:hypothetical protein
VFPEEGSLRGQVVMDTVLNEFMVPVFSNEPTEVKRRLKAGYSETWVKVLVGDTGVVVTVPEYLYAEKYSDILEMLRELLRKQDLPMYRRNPERLEIYLQSTARKLIERVLDK